MTTQPDPVRQARSRLGNTVRSAGDDPEAVAQARRLLTVAKVQRQINEAVNADPAITTEQRLFLADLLVTAAPLTPDERNRAASLMATNGSLR